MKSIIIDVREDDEYAAEHIENSIHIPLSSFDKKAPSVLKSLAGQNITIMCRSGKRASLAASAATRLCGKEAQCEVFEGGILEWKKQGKPTVAAKKIRLPIMRQVQLTAGLLVLTGSLLTHFVNPGFFYLTGFVGLGLTVAGSTGFCGMANLLALMPWNKEAK
jgi:rhodanese-related sulfurtransferase